MKHNFAETAPLNQLLRAGPRRRWSPLASVLVSSLIASTPVSAAERVWDGSARGNGWNDIGNWVGTGVTVAGDPLRFPAGAFKPANNNDFPAGTVFNALTYEGACRRWPGGMPAKVQSQTEHELELIAELGYEHYFLTVADIVRCAQSQHILCQGRGSRQARRATACGSRGSSWGILATIS